MVDLLILEDTNLVRNVYEDLASSAGLVFVSFSSGIQAHSYISRCLESRSTLPKGVLSDMNICTNNGEAIRGSSLRTEQASPEALFNLVKSYGGDDNFVFVTGHLSDHDLGVKDRTGADVIIKPGFEETNEFLRGLKSVRNYSHPSPSSTLNIS